MQIRTEIRSGEVNDDVWHPGDGVRVPDVGDACLANDTMNVDSHYRHGRRAWPDFTVDRERFARHLDRHGGNPGHVDDLYLAFACAEGVPAAITALERERIAQIPLLVARLESSAETAAEVQQLVREHLLVAPRGRKLRIANYSGRGTLLGWIRAIAINFLRRLRRRAARLPPVAYSELVADIDPEIALIRAQHKRDFEQGLHSAIACLSPFERALIKMHLIDGLTIDELGTIHGVHRSTAARWLVKLKQRLLGDVLRIVGTRLRLDEHEVEERLALVFNQIDPCLELLHDDVTLPAGPGAQPALTVGQSD
jgi:RNA polymerase sigma-70 factor (ECF subfamily)